MGYYKFGVRLREKFEIIEYGLKKREIQRILFTKE